MYVYAYNYVYTKALMQWWRKMVELGGANLLNRKYYFYGKNQVGYCTAP